MSLELSISAKELREKFFGLKTKRDIATLLDVTAGQLNYYLYRVPEGSRYTKFNIHKRSGGQREINAPSTALKIIQRKLNQVLQAVYRPKPPVHGFAPGRSILSNAELHSNRRNILNLDLKDFFPTINFGRVRGMFKGKPYNLNSLVSTILAQICCFENSLPQGAPTSPIVSNMICGKMDSELLQLAKKNKSNYTRYADDITFSTSLRDMPNDIAIRNPDDQFIVGSALEKLIGDNGFIINILKVRLQTKYMRQEVTGLITNKRPNVKRKFVRQIRAMLHAWDKYGYKAAEQEYLNKYNNKYRQHPRYSPSFANVVKGKLEFLGMIKGKTSPIYIRFRDKLKNVAPRLVKGPVNQLEPLAEMYNDLKKAKNKQERGFLLQNLLNRLFKLYPFPMLESFLRNKGAEQIDGAFKLDGWFYIVECRWRKHLADIRELDGLIGQVQRSGKQTMGLFLSINGWSKNVPVLLKQNPEKSIILMNGDDVDFVLGGKVDFIDLILAKVASLNFKTEPFFSAKRYMRQKK